MSSLLIPSQWSWLEDDVSDGLKAEKTVILRAVEEIIRDGKILGREKTQCLAKSKYFRKTADEIYKLKSHSDDDHISAWIFYNKSIAYAPETSKELVKAYLARSKFLFHLQKFEDCFEDCDKGMNLRPSRNHFQSNLFKAELKVRAIECLIAMGHPQAAVECEHTLTFIKLSRLHSHKLLNYSKKKLLRRKIRNSMKIISKRETQSEERAYKDRLEFPDFDYDPANVSCASRFVRPHFDEKWGRCVLATDDIKPGQILVVEKNFFTSPVNDQTYMMCSNCSKICWTLKPCGHCVFSFYCSEECKMEDWIQCHEYECIVAPYFYDDIKSKLRSMFRLMLLAVKKAGGINNLKNDMRSIQEPTDVQISLREFYSGVSPKSVYSRSQNDEQLKKLPLNLAIFSCHAAYHLATKTHFFGNKLFSMGSMSKVLKNADVIFVAALILRNYLILNNSVLQYNLYNKNCDPIRTNVSLYPFCSTFNNSCDPNASYFTTKDNEIVVFAKHPIRKGSQIFISYLNQHYSKKNREQRQYEIKEMYNFGCSCTACLENWTSKKEKQLTSLLTNNKELFNELQFLYEATTKDLCINNCACDVIQYDYNSIGNIVKTLDILAHKFSVHSTEYEILSKYLYKIYVKTFGSRLDMPTNC